MTCKFIRKKQKELKFRSSFCIAKNLLVLQKIVTLLLNRKMTRNKQYYMDRYFIIDIMFA